MGPLPRSAAGTTAERARQLPQVQESAAAAAAAVARTVAQRDADGAAAHARAITRAAEATSGPSPALAFSANRNGHVADLDVSRFVLEPFFAAVAARFHDGRESRRIGAQHVERHALAFRHVRGDAHRADRHALLRRLVEA